MDDPGGRAVHGGESRDPTHGSVATPIVLSSTFDYPELENGHRAPYIYTRYDNPTVRSTEARIAALERTEDAVLFSSGMAAIAAAVLTRAQSGQRIVASPVLYGGTRELFDHELPRLGIRVHYLPDDALFRPDRLGDHLEPDDALLYLESPTNPMLRILDIPALTRVAHDHQIPVALDNTFASPILADAASWHVDHIIESATKHLGGHSDLIAGSVAGNADAMAPIRRHRKRWGSNPDPAAAYRLLRGLATLPLRIERAGQSAATLAAQLATEPWVQSVHHPGRTDHPDHGTATRTLAGPLPLVTFVVAGGDDAAVRLRRRLRQIRPAASLGGVETLLSLPFETSQAGLTRAERHAIGIPDGTVRLAVGLEPADALLADLRQAASGGDPTPKSQLL